MTLDPRIDQSRNPPRPKDFDLILHPGAAKRTQRVSHKLEVSPASGQFWKKKGSPQKQFKLPWERNLEDRVIQESPEESQIKKN